MPNLDARMTNMLRQVLGPELAAELLDMCFIREKLQGIIRAWKAPPPEAGEAAALISDIRLEGFKANEGILKGGIDRILGYLAAKAGAESRRLVEIALEGR